MAKTSTSAQAGASSDLQTVAQRLKTWRGTRRPGQRIPEDLWRAATDLARRHGLSRTATPAIIMRIVGSPPIADTGYTLAKLRCDACGQVFTAPVPAAAGQEKYAPSVPVTIAVLRYGTGLRHYLLAIATHAADVQARPSAWLPWSYPQSENPAALHHDPPGLPG